MICGLALAFGTLGGQVRGHYVMKPLFTIHGGEYLVGSYIERHFKRVNVWVPSRDTGVDLLVSDRIHPAIGFPRFRVAHALLRQIARIALIDLLDGRVRVIRLILPRKGYSRPSTRQSTRRLTSRR